MLQDYESLIYGGGAVTMADAPEEIKQEYLAQKEKAAEPLPKPISEEPMPEQQDEDFPPLPPPPPSQSDAYSYTAHEEESRGRRSKKQEKIEEAFLFDAEHQHNLETSAIGCILIAYAFNDSKNYANIVIESLDEEDFVNEGYKAIFRAAVALHEQEPDVAIDLISLSSKFDTDGKDRYVFTLMLDAMSFTPTALNAEYYCKELREARIKRQVAKGLQDAATAAREGDEDYLGAVKKVSEEAERLSPIRVSRVGQEVYETFTELGDKKRPKPIPTGLPSVDKLIGGGMRPGEMVVVGARPSMGKTSVTLNIVNRALESGKVCVIFTMDGSKDSVLLRMICMRSLIPLSDIMFFSTLEDTRGVDMSGFVNATGNAQYFLSEAPLYIDDCPSASIERIRSTLRQVQMREKHVDLVMVDYIGQMDVSTTTAAKSRSSSRAQQISEISSKLKIAAKDFNCVMLVLSQFNRSIESRGDKKPVMSDLKESGGIEADANIILFPYLPWKDDDTIDKLEAIMYVAKSKDSATGTVNLHFDGSIFTMYEGENPREAAKRALSSGSRKALPASDEWKDVDSDDIPFE